MSTPGDDDQTPRRTGGQVDPPEIADGVAGRYSPAYETPPAEPASRTGESRWGLLAPVAAAVVLVGGIGFLISSSGSDEPTTTDAPRIAQVGDPDEPLAESTAPGDPVAETAPIPTSPPLLGPTTTSGDATDPTVSDVSTSTSTSTTVDVGTGGPTRAQLDAALLGLDDIGSGDWTEEIPEFDEVCGTVPDEEVTDARADSLFQTILDDPFGVRQISNSLVTFATPELAAAAFDGDVALLVACDATTIDLNGVQYRVRVESDSFTDEQAAAFPCADQSSFLILQLTNDAAVVPYIGQSAVSFRCGRNITVTALTTTIGIDDLNDEDYFNAAGISNARTGALPGS